MFVVHVPTLLFITSFSLLIYFFAKVLLEESGNQNSNLTFCVVSNGAMYLVFFIVGIYYMNDKNSISENFSKTISGLYGTCFVILSIVFSNYGLRLTILLSQLKDEEQTVDARPTEDSLISLLYKRVLLITIVLSCIFFCTCIYNFIFTWGLMEQKDPQQVNPLLWESITQFFSELIPTIAILSLTHRNRRKKEQYFYYYESLIDSESDEEFGTFNPNLRNDVQDAGFPDSPELQAKIGYNPAF
jgi:hypothetical protein